MLSLPVRVRKIALNILLNNCLSSITIKEILPCKELIEDRTQAKYIYLVTIVSTLEYFRGDIPWRTAFARDTIIIWGKYCQAKICYSNIILRTVLDRADEYIF